jgi:hypothetical protein
MATVKETLFDALGAFRAATTVGKSGKNPMFKSEYTTLGDVLTALADVGKYGLGFEQHLHDGQLVTTVVHLKTGESFSSAMVLHPEKQTPQSLIAAVTYYRRVQLMTMFGLNADDDDGNLASSDRGSSLASGATPSGSASSSAGSGGTSNQIGF